MRDHLQLVILTGLLRQLDAISNSNWTEWSTIQGVIGRVIGTFRSDYEYEYEYEYFHVHPMRMPDCVRLSRQLVLSSKSRRCLDANYEIFSKSLPPTTSSLQVQRRVKRLVFKGADTL